MFRCKNSEIYLHNLYSDGHYDDFFTFLLSANIQIEDIIYQVNITEFLRYEFLLFMFYSLAYHF